MLNSGSTPGLSFLFFLGVIMDATIAFILLLLIAPPYVVIFSEWLKDKRKEREDS